MSADLCPKCRLVQDYDEHAMRLRERVAEAELVIREAFAKLDKIVCCSICQDAAVDGSDAQCQTCAARTVLRRAVALQNSEEK